MTIVGTPIRGAEFQKVSEKKQGRAQLAVIGIAGVLVTAALVALCGGRKGRTERGTETEKPVGKKTPREVADTEKRRLTPQEMGRKGAQKRWEKKKALEAKKAEEEEAAAVEDDSATIPA